MDIAVIIVFVMSLVIVVVTAGIVMFIDAKILIVSIIFIVPVLTCSVITCDSYDKSHDVRYILCGQSSWSLHSSVCSVLNTTVC